MTKYLSINTDDFGLSKSIDKGIIEAFKSEILTDASLMANGPNFNRAVEIIKELGISIAAHINLIRGKMLTEFEAQPSVFKFWKNSFSSSYLSKIEKEARAQIELILKKGIKINQLNSEKHSHFFPIIFKLWIRLAEEYEIPYIRFIREFNMSPSMQGVKANLLSLFSIKNREYLRNSEINTTDYFQGILATGKLDFDELKKILLKIKEGWTELMVHIGHTGEIDNSMGKYFLNETRETELKALLNPELKDIISLLGIELKSFGGKDV